MQSELEDSAVMSLPVSSMLQLILALVIIARNSLWAIKLTVAGFRLSGIPLHCQCILSSVVTCSWPQNLGGFEDPT